jgi:hypothetical protein
MIKPGCPSAAPADVMVTRSNVPVPSCEAGQNATKPSIMTMSGYGGGVMPTGMATMPGMPGASGTETGAPAMFTGAASSVKAGGAMVVLGGLAAFVL